jgi:hypothetical protein
MTRIGAAQLSSWAVMMATESMLVAGGAMLLRFTARHPDLLPVHVVATLLYDAPLAFAFAVVAVAIMRRLPRHPIGWLFGLLGAAVAFGLFTKRWLPATCCSASPRPLGRRCVPAPPESPSPFPAAR